MERDTVRSNLIQNMCFVYTTNNNKALSQNLRMRRNTCHERQVLFPPRPWCLQPKYCSTVLVRENVKARSISNRERACVGCIHCPRLGEERVGGKMDRENNEKEAIFIHLCYGPSEHFKVTPLRVRVNSGSCYLTWVRVASVCPTDIKQAPYSPLASQDALLSAHPQKGCSAPQILARSSSPAL